MVRKGSRVQIPTTAQRKSTAIINSFLYKNMSKKITPKIKYGSIPLTGKERVANLRQAIGVFKGRKKDPIKELEEMRARG